MLSSTISETVELESVENITSKSRLAVDREFMYIGSAGPGPGGRTGGRAEGGRADGGPRPGGLAGGWAGGRDDFERQYNDFHRFSQKKQQKTFCFSVVSHPAEAQVPIFTAQMKKASKKCQKSIVFF